MKIFIHKFKSLFSVGNYINTQRLFTTLSISILLSLISFISVGQGTFSWFNGTTGNVWNATDVSTGRSYTISCGTGCTVTVTMTIIDPNNRNCDPDTYNTNPFDAGGGCLPYPGVTGQADNVAGNGNILDPWDSDCAPFYTQTSGAYGLGYLTFAMNSFTHLEDVIVRFTFSKPVFLDAFTIGDIDGRTLQQDRTQNQTGSPSTLSVYELPGNSYQDEVTVTATGPMGNVPVNYSALGSLLTQVGQTVRCTYDNTATNLTPDDARGTITVNTTDAITQLDISYSNGPDDAAAEQANPTWYSWWVNGGTYTLSDGRTITQPAKGATNGVSDNQAIRISGFTFTACPDFTFTRTNATVCSGSTATIGIVPSNGVAPYTYSWTGPNGFTSTSQNPLITNVTAAQGGIYTVTATDSNGCTGTSTAQVTVNPLPIPSITGTNNLSCTTTSVTRTASGGGTYLWSSGLGTAATVNINTTGIYTVTVTNSATGCTTTATTSVTLNNTPPTAGITGVGNLSCTVTTAIRTATGGGTYLWSNNLGTASTVNITTAGVYTVTVTDAINGCTTTATTSVTLNNTPPTAGITGAGNLSCITTTVTRTATGGGAYLWSNNLGTAATVNITTTGTYTVTVTDATNGCTATATTNVTSGGITGVTAQPSVCSPTTNSYSVSGSVSFTNPPTTGTLTISIGSQSVVFNAPFTSPISYTISNLISDGASHTVSANFSAISCPATTNYTAPVSCACPTTTYPICAGESYTLTAQSGLTGYQWYLISGTDTTAIAGATSQVYIANEVGKYIWKATDVSLCPILLCCPVNLVQGNCYGSIGDYVWSDVNSDGQQTSGEPALPGVKVYLLNASGVKIDSTVTDAKGKYLFDSLTTGSYRIQFVAPTGTIASKQNVGADGTDSDANKLGLSQLISIDTSKLPTDSLRNNLNIDAGFVPVGSIGDYVFNDKDGDGIQDPTDAPLAGIKVYLIDATTGVKLDSTVTGTDGLYKFDSLLSGSYKVQFVIPVGSEASPKTAGSDPTKDSNINPNGTTDAITIDATKPLGDPLRDNTTVDAGIKPAYGSIGDYVWSDVNNNGQQDGTETPLAGVKVYLLNASGVKIDSTVTDATGKYLFDSLTTGSYRVQFVAPTGTIASKQNVGADGTDSDANKLGLSQLISIDASKLPTDSLRNNLNIDAGFVPVGSIGDYVFNDKDGDGIQDPTDAPLAGIKVYLIDATTGVKLDSTVTGTDGLYKFDSLLSGSYKVQFVIPVGSEASPKTAGSDPTKDSNINPNGTTDAITIDATKPLGDPLRDNTTVDAGIKPAYGSIGDYVWSDVNNNGQQDGTETPLAGVKVYLLNASGVKIDSTVTDVTGKYLFDSLTTGSYRVQFVAPTGTIASKQNVGADGTDSDANKLGLSQLISIDASKLPTDSLRNNLNIDAGFVPVGSIGDYVFEDKDKSNTQTAGDTPLAGVKVYLLDATTGAKLDSTTSDINGLYVFDSLVAGNYKVQFVAPSGTLLADKASGTDVTKDSNPDPLTGITDTITLDTTKPIGDPARNNKTIDAGIQLIPAFGSIGDYVWTDKNNNGQQDSGEAPIAGVKVYLYDATGTTKLDSALTDGAGKYLFDSLLTGNYLVKFVAPAGTIAAKQNTGPDVTDSDANNLGWSQLISIDVTKAETDTLRNNTQVDAGFVPVGSIGDYVFQDKDNSNTQTTGDVPVEGVKVYLLDATTGAKLDSTITDGNGLYKFDSLVAGSYKVQVVIPTGMLPATKDTGTDDTKDSDINPTGITDTVTIDTTKPIGDPARDNTSVDAGLQGIPQYGSIGDYVWSDANNDGQQGVGEAPIAGVKLYLYDGTGTIKLDSAITDGTGKYLFDSLLTGTYKVKFVTPAGTVPTFQNTGADATDSDINDLGWSQLISIDVTKPTTDTLRNNTQIDAGFVPLGSIGDYVFEDKDNSNTQTSGDQPIACIKVYLLDGITGAILDSTMTDASGKYLFDSLLAGSYKIQFEAPIGGTFVTKTSGTDTTKDSNPDVTGLTDAIVIDTTKPVGDPARDNTSVDAGMKLVGPFGSIGDYVWLDTNNNGQQDSGEAPIAGVKVYLYDGTGSVIMDSTVTDATGKYLFDSLFTASYKVKFVAPVGTIVAKQNTGADVSDSDISKTGWSQVINIDVTKAETDTLRNNLQIDAGFVPVGSIGDYVFQDKDESNTQTAGDLPVQGVKVYLLNVSGVKIDSTITDGNGLYKFDSLLAGTYKVQFVAPDGTNIVSKNAGTDTTKDSNPDPLTGITDSIVLNTNAPVGDPTRDITQVDAGIKGQLQYGSIGDYVWTDSDNDGQQDSGEAPIAGVKVLLYDATGTILLDSTTTETLGKYLFDSLLTGDYRVKFIAPAGMIAAKANVGSDVTDSDANALGLSPIISIDVTKAETDILRNNPQIDAGFVPVGSIGDYVFADNDKSSTQTAGDTPVAGVKVYLLDAVTGAKLDSTVTNINGLYKFDSLLAGIYKVQFIAPTGTALVTKDSGIDDTKDSDADATGTTGIVTVDTTKPVGDPARDITSVDAGLTYKVDLKLTKIATGDCKRKAGDVVSFKIMVKRQDLIVTDVAATVKDSLSANFEFVSATATEGTYSNTTGIWSSISLAKGDSAVLTLNARIKQGATGLVCNDAWIQTMDKEDFDSIAGNKVETEDDFARACVSVPLPVCTARGEKAELTAPAGYTSYQWFKNGQAITGATSSTYLATTFGEYTVTVNNGSCPSTGCCPIYVDEFCDCPPTICVPFVIQKTKSKK